ncbi:MarR family winged helix-turn-helix transcriptional regulator [Fictibacillus iocasae]|uniref:MarR family winged helix-turn-helix transcriptional regulator n=1 Tax=Fictibacillus iocasae TaxID=2715437 RepID=A0ABW2NRM7_9BACL
MRGLASDLLLDIERLESAYNEILEVLKPEIWEEEEVTATQFHILKTLIKKEKWTVTEIADAMRVRASATTVIIDRLVKRGLVNRYRSDLDRRIVYVEINPDGKDTYERINSKRNSVLMKYISQLPESTLVQLVSSFEQLAAVIKNK